MQDDLISRQAALDCFTATKLKKFDFILYAREEIKKLPSVKPQEPNKGHCEDCKHFRKLPYHIDIVGKCICHTGFCPRGDWYCADYEPQEERMNETDN